LHLFLGRWLCHCDYCFGFVRVCSYAFGTDDLNKHIPLADPENIFLWVKPKARFPEVGEGLLDVCYVNLFILAHHYNIINICNDVSLELGTQDFGRRPCEGCACVF
jgi:hypothetical protein